MNDREFGDWLSARFNEPEPYVDSSDVADRVLNRARNERLARHAMLGASALVGAGTWLAVTGARTSLALVASGFGQALRMLETTAVPAAVVLCLVLTALAAWRTATTR